MGEVVGFCVQLLPEEDYYIFTREDLGLLHF